MLFIYLVAPLLLVGPSAMNATLSENFTLVCSASGYPVPTIIWTHNGTLVNEDEHDRATITPQLIASRSFISALTVSGAMINDSGDYVCSVASSIRDFQPLMAAPATVLVQGNVTFIYILLYCKSPAFSPTPLSQNKTTHSPYTARPEQPQNIAPVNTTSHAITLVWEEPHNNNAPIAGYRVTYQQPSFLDTSDGVQVVNSTVEMADITGLHPGVTYNFTVVAFNEIGDSTPSHVVSVSTVEEGMLVKTFTH